MLLHGYKSIAIHHVIALQRCLCGSDKLEVVPALIPGGLHGNISPKKNRFFPHWKQNILVETFSKEKHLY